MWKRSSDGAAPPASTTRTDASDTGASTVTGALWSRIAATWARVASGGVGGDPGGGDAVIGHDDDDPRLRGRAWRAVALRGGEPHTQLGEPAQRAGGHGEGGVAGDRGPTGLDVRRGHLGEIHAVILPGPPP